MNQLKQLNLNQLLGHLLRRLEQADLKATVQLLNEVIFELDSRISESVGTIICQTDFRELKGKWAGIRYWVFKTPLAYYNEVQIDLLNCTKEELRIDVEEPYFSRLCKETYSDPIESYRHCEPFGILVGDYEFNDAADIEMLENISESLEFSFTQFLACPGPAFWDSPSFSNLHKEEHDKSRKKGARWEMLRKKESSRYVSLVLPRLSADIFDDEVDAERPEARMPNHTCWISPAYALAERITYSFAQYGGPTQFRGPIREIGPASETVDFKIELETSFSDGELNWFMGMGFTTLAPGGDSVAHLRNTSTLRKLDDWDDESVLQSDLALQLAVNRLTQMLIKYDANHCVTHEFQTAAQLEQALNNHLEKYSCEEDAACENEHTPFISAHVEVVSKSSHRVQLKICVKPRLLFDKHSTEFTVLASTSHLF